MQQFGEIHQRPKSIRVEGLCFQIFSFFLFTFPHSSNQSSMRNVVWIPRNVFNSSKEKTITDAHSYPTKECPLNSTVKCKWIDPYTVISNIRCNYRSGAALHSGIQCSLFCCCAAPKVVTSSTQTRWHPFVGSPLILQRKREEKEQWWTESWAKRKKKKSSAFLALGSTHILSSNYH